MKDLAKKRIKELLTYLESKADISFKESPNSLSIRLQNAKDAELLIGYKGENLRALQHILRLLVLKDMGGEPSGALILDIEDYRKNEEEKLMAYVKNVAQIVKETQHAEALRSMSSYKRRLVHMAVSEVSGVVAESFGEEPDRRIIIKPEEDK